jgi:hypothetical protein
LAYSSTLKMEATCSFETSADFQRTTLRYIQKAELFRIINVCSYRRISLVNFVYRSVISTGCPISHYASPVYGFFGSVSTIMVDTSTTGCISWFFVNSSTSFEVLHKRRHHTQTLISRR